MSDFLPKNIDKIVVPPIKCQGIKTKLINFIAATIKWDGGGKWIEPFLGSGVVLFNIKPERALVSDTNKHIIGFYRDLQGDHIDAKIVKDHLEEMGAKLYKHGGDFFYEVRDQFNTEGGDSLKLLFLNRCCYNGIMRFNSQGKFNVPFGHKPERFRRAYITKIVNQVSKIRQIIRNRDWQFQVQDWRKTMSHAYPEDFVYMDPPYIGRHTDYYNNWTDNDATELANVSSQLKCGFALSMWKENKYRENVHLSLCWNEFVTKTFSHFYHVGSKEKFRNEITEALVLRAENVAQSDKQQLSQLEPPEVEQLNIFS
ncbi:Dam family site-specific DNA-(adenine-N6)-methyltransferase [bacterium]|nr:Dam family site-specific DNA-(adenine-N6)-methyltransferase [bacterium]